MSTGREKESEGQSKHKWSCQGGVVCIAVRRFYSPKPGPGWLYSCSSWLNSLLTLGACVRVIVVSLSVCLSVNDLVPAYDVCATN